MVAALVTSFLSVVYAIVQTVRKVKELQRIKAREDVRVPAMSQGLRHALADDDRQRGAEEPKKDVLAPSGQGGSTPISIESLKQGHIGAQ